MIIVLFLNNVWSRWLDDHASYASVVIIPWTISKHVFYVNLGELHIDDLDVIAEANSCSSNCLPLPIEPRLFTASSTMSLQTYLVTWVSLLGLYFSQLKKVYS